MTGLAISQLQVGSRRVVRHPETILHPSWILLCFGKLVKLQHFDGF